MDVRQEATRLYELMPPDRRPRIVDPIFMDAFLLRGYTRHFGGNIRQSPVYQQLIANMTPESDLSLDEIIESLPTTDSNKIFTYKVAKSQIMLNFLDYMFNLKHAIISGDIRDASPEAAFYRQEYVRLYGPVKAELDFFPEGPPVNPLSRSANAVAYRQELVRLFGPVAAEEILLNLATLDALERRKHLLHLRKVLPPNYSRGGRRKRKTRRTRKTSGKN